MNTFRLPDDTHTGYIHLRVADLPRALAFYRDQLGFREITREDNTAYLSATGATPHHIVLTELPGAQPKPPHSTGLYHAAIRFPNRRALAQVVKRLITSGYPFQGASDHGVSEAFYLADPDGNGLELYRDRPRSEWKLTSDGQISMGTDPLNVQEIFAEADDNAAWNGIDRGTDIGHIHLQVSDLARTEVFYHELLGLDVVQRGYPGALFMSAGGYHHHLGVNTWAGRNVTPPPPDAVGLIAFALVVPHRDTWRALIDRAREYNVTVEDLHTDSGTAGALLRDPDQNGVVLLTVE